jgi:hypothetical protein
MVLRRASADPVLRMARIEDTGLAGGATTFDRRVAKCCGFQVEDADGRLGYVVETVRAADGRPRGLVVRVGLFRKHVVFISTGDVKAVRPERKRVVVAPGYGPARAGSSPGSTSGVDSLKKVEGEVR